jgi:hypothetical protein
VLLDPAEQTTNIPGRKQEIGQAVWFKVKHLHFIQEIQGVSTVLGPGYFEDFGDIRFRYNKSI